MGVPRFYGNFVSKIPVGFNVKRLSLPPNIGWLYLDMNGIFHNVAQKVYGYASISPGPNEKREREEQERRLAAMAQMSDEELEKEYFAWIKY